MFILKKNYSNTTYSLLSWRNPGTATGFRKIHLLSEPVITVNQFSCHICTLSLRQGSPGGWEWNYTLFFFSLCFKKCTPVNNLNSRTSEGRDITIAAYRPGVLFPLWGGSTSQDSYRWLRKSSSRGGTFSELLVARRRSEEELTRGA